MSAPHIPNLLSLRGASRGRGSARGRGAGVSGRGGRFTPAGAAHDATIQGTDTDAAVSRLSAVSVGYLDDPYAQYFAQSPPTRRLPIINRGTYTRTTALDALVDSFLSSDGDEADASSPRQIVSLGAGTDTRPFMIYAQRRGRPVIYHEVDFEVVSSRKLRTVQTNARLSGVLTDLSAQEDSTTWTARPVVGSGEYLCHGLDLRKLQEPGEEELIPGLRTDIPTLLLSECCLCYLSPQQASGVLDYFTSRIPSLATVIYEPVRPHDAFGQVMVSNLAARRIQMPTLSLYPEPEDQANRLKEAGFDVVRQMTIGDIWQAWVHPDEKARLDEMEGLDEVEEWQLLAAHYIVVWGSRGDGFASWNNIP